MDYGVTGRESHEFTIMFKDKAVLISGINGFIGTNLAWLLKEHGAVVAGLPRELLTMPSGLQEVVEELNPAYIFHLAAYGNHSTQDDIDETFATNVIKTYNLMRSSANVDYKAFINISTSSVYGIVNKPMSESDKINPNTPYACTKAAGEHLAEMFAYTFEKPIVNVRPFSVYGPGERVDRLIPVIIKSMVTGEPMELFPDPVHDWIYIEDFINGLFAVCENVKALKGLSVNVGTGVQYSNAEIMEKLLGIDPGAEFDITEPRVLVRKYDTDISWVADTARLKKYGWSPEVDIDEGLERTYDYYKDIYDEIDAQVVEEFDPVKKSLDDMGIEFKDPKKELDLDELAKKTNN